MGIPRQREYTYEDWKKVMVPPSAKWIAEPCIELAYVIGVLHGDGSVSKVKHKNEPRYEYRIRLAVIDKEFVETFSRAMSRLLGVNHYEPYWSKKQKRWCVEYRSKAFYTWYKKCEEQGIEGFKSFIEYNRETVKYCLRGLYDSEGYNYRNKQIHLDNSYKELLEYT